MRGEGGEKRKRRGGGRDEEGETRTKREIFQATRNTVRRDVTHKKNSLSKIASGTCS